MNSASDNQTSLFNTIEPIEIFARVISNQSDFSTVLFEISEPTFNQLIDAGFQVGVRFNAKFGTYNLSSRVCTDSFAERHNLHKRSELAPFANVSMYLEQKSFTGRDGVERPSLEVYVHTISEPTTRPEHTRSDDKVQSIVKLLRKRNDTLA